MVKPQGFVLCVIQPLSVLNTFVLKVSFHGIQRHFKCNWTKVMRTKRYREKCIKPVKNKRFDKFTGPVKIQIPLKSRYQKNQKSFFFLFLKHPPLGGRESVQQMSPSLYAGSLSRARTWEIKFTWYHDDILRKKNGFIFDCICPSSALSLCYSSSHTYIFKVICMIVNEIVGKEKPSFFLVKISLE